jgi:DNA-binding MarR family transcriptional regulator
MSTRWLTDAEMEAWLTFNLASRLIDEQLDQQLQRDSDMLHTYYGVLVMLSQAEDRSQRMSQLASRLCFSPSRLTHAVVRLERRGWVRRETCPDDGRGQIAVLTDEGFEAIRVAAPGHVAEVRRVLLDALSAEQVGQLRDIFATVLDTLDVARPIVTAKRSSKRR